MSDNKRKQFYMCM